MDQEVKNIAKSNERMEERLQLLEGNKGHRSKGLVN